MYNQDDIQHYRGLLTKYRRNLATALERQAVQGGPNYSDVGLTNYIDSQRAEIRKTKHTLRHQYKVVVDDLSDDEPVEPSTTYQRQRFVGGSFQSAPSFSAIVSSYPLALDIRDHLQKHQGSFDTLQSYKHLHDLFQRLEGSHKGCAFEYKNNKLLLQKVRWKSLSSIFIGVKTCIKSIITYVAEHGLIADTILNARSWLPPLKQVVDQIDYVVEQRDVYQLTELDRYIIEVIDKQPSRVNLLLVGAAGQINLRALSKMTQNLATDLKERQPAPEYSVVCTRLRDDCESLSHDLHTLDTLVGIHNDFQTVDDELREIKIRQYKKAVELRRRWQFRREILDGLCKQKTDWATTLEVYTQTVDAIMAGSDAAAIRGRLDTYQGQIFQTFCEIDDMLLHACRRLCSPEGPLQRVQKVLLYE